MKQIPSYNFRDETIIVVIFIFTEKRKREKGKNQSILSTKGLLDFFTFAQSPSPNPPIIIAAAAAADQRIDLLVAVIVLVGGDSDAGAPLQGGEEGAGDAVDHPHRHSVELRAAGARPPHPRRGGAAAECGSCHARWAAE